ncbi:MAG TPA: hypothetical protein VKQ70_00995 [Caulobacteraceae bacterium]|nr:hypothetical protein [Caulobacteraceae bacterium]
MRQLAMFWLVCAATGFMAAVGVAFLLSLAIDNRLSWKRPVPLPIARVLEHLQTQPHETLDALAPVGVR